MRTLGIVLAILFCILIIGCKSDYSKISKLEQKSSIKTTLDESTDLIVKSVPVPIDTEGVTGLYSVGVSENGYYGLELTTISDLKYNEIVFRKVVQIHYNSDRYDDFYPFIVRAKSKEETSKLLELPTSAN